MFSASHKDELESLLRKRTHCWLKFHSTDDYYVAEVSEYIFNSNGLTLVLKRMSKCRLLIIDHRFGTKKWFAVQHLHTYTMRDLNLEEMRNRLSQQDLSSDSRDLSFLMENGDELIFTDQLSTKKEIEEILSMAL